MIAKNASAHFRPLKKIGAGSRIAIGREERREIAATVDDAHDVDRGGADAIEEHGRVHDDRSDTGVELVARNARLR